MLKRTRILIYDVSDTAIDLLNAFTYSKQYQVVGFLAPCGQRMIRLAGYPVVRISDLGAFCEKTGVTMVVFIDGEESSAIPTKLLHQLNLLGLSSSYAPSMDRAFDYEVQLSAVDPAKVLGRPEKANIDGRIAKEFINKTVLVTGAGGSIGQELCQQLLSLKAKKYIFLDHSEIALYNLEQNHNEKILKSSSKIDVEYIMGSITDKDWLTNIFETFNIDIIYHAAAYKHVPIVEKNPRAALFNNVFGTHNLCLLAEKHKISKFVLVSTDKAVRPTNIMGASKRLAELVCQSFNGESNTTFTMVRFGNVLGSSGSVIPKFKEQINSGGPVLVTHPDITRYFMSIPEAVSLILSAGSMATGGEVFLIDMGKPVKIVDLARSMILQHGRRPKDQATAHTTIHQQKLIDIEFCGLRPGEKLYEELLIDDKAISTHDSKIFRATDPGIDKESLGKILSDLSEIMEKNDIEQIQNYLKSIPIGYSGMIDEAKSFEIQSQGLEPSQLEDDSRRNKNLSKESLVKKIISSRVISKTLHQYFYFSRGMTLGVRVMVTNEKNEVLLVKHNYQDGWHFPGGGVDHGEVIYEAAKREVAEETGLVEIDIYSGPTIYLNAGVSKRDHIVFYRASVAKAKLLSPQWEISDVQFFPLDFLPSDIEEGTLKRINESQKSSVTTKIFTKYWC